MDQTRRTTFERLDQAAVRPHKVPDLVRALDPCRTRFGQTTGGAPQEEDPELSAT